MPNCGENYPYDGGCYEPEPWTTEQIEAYKKYKIVEHKAFVALRKCFPSLDLSGNKAYWMLFDYSDFPIGDENAEIISSWISQVKYRYPHGEASSDFFDSEEDQELRRQEYQVGAMK